MRTVKTVQCTSSFDIVLHILYIIINITMLRIPGLYYTVLLLEVIIFHVVSSSFQQYWPSHTSVTQNFKFRNTCYIYLLVFKTTIKLICHSHKKVNQLYTYREWSPMDTNTFVKQCPIWSLSFTLKWLQIYSRVSEKTFQVVYDKDCSVRH